MDFIFYSIVFALDVLVCWASGWQTSLVIDRYFNMSNFLSAHLMFFSLAEYTSENPKIVTKCSHHFHLGCIYEWMERSDNCPVCGKVWFLSSVVSCKLVQSLSQSSPIGCVIVSDSDWCLDLFKFWKLWNLRFFIKFVFLLFIKLVWLYDFTLMILSKDNCYLYMDRA